ncbi:RNA-guided endonuclease InsQ/TnpB family protein, partial [Vibrio parahaemolyticus]|uniref:RNA-guided endonuclease InsQ/TnpB family protein n=1 Tax=Vibrio parahaemolyticus TaxID=670 RepID=UPI000A7A4564
IWPSQQYRLKRGHYVENYATMCLHLTQVKKHFTFLKEVDSTVLQQTLKDLDKAYKDAFDKTQPNKRMPVTKKRSKCNNGFRYTGRFKVEDRRVYLPKLGSFGFFKSRDIIGKIKNTTVTHKAGHWYVSFQTEYERADRPHNSKSMVGVDLGVKRLATLSNGFYVDGLSALKVHSKTLAKLQRKLAKKTRFSNNWKKVKQKIARLHSKISAVRHDFLHKFSSYLSKNHAIIVFEDLKVNNMTQSSKGTLDEPGKKVKQKTGLNKSILEQGWGMLIGFLQIQAAVEKWYCFKG